MSRLRAPTIYEALGKQETTLSVDELLSENAALKEENCILRQELTIHGFFEMKKDLEVCVEALRIFANDGETFPNIAQEALAKLKTRKG